MPQNRLLSGQITVETAGTAVQGTDVASWFGHTGGFFVRALSANTGKIYVGNDNAGDVTSSNGYELSAGDVIFVQCANLNEYWFDASVSGEKACWVKA